LFEGGGPSLEPTAGPNAPRIEAVFAPDEINALATWRIYLKGSDPEADLLYINILVQVPWGESRAQVPIEPGPGRSLSGYLAFNTAMFSSFTPLWLRVHLALEDRAGRRSQPVTVTTSFSAWAAPSGPSRGFFAETMLGRVPVILSPTDAGQGM
jgi:hypothetical protein